MSDPIDLDLVELRAKVRGWPVLPGEDELCVETPHGDVWVQADGTAYSVFASADSRGPRCPVIALLTAPRWTLARLLDSPPEGWRVMGRMGPNRGTVLGWGDRVGWLEPPEDSAELMVEVRKGAGRCVMYAHPHGYHDGGYSFARLAERHKAAAELALILAEVEP